MERYLTLAAVLVVAFLGYDFYYSFQKSPSSPLVRQRNALEAIHRENADYDAKIKKAEEFNRTLEQKIAELRLLSAQLAEFKVTLSEDFDSSLYGTLTNESRRAGVQISNFAKQNTKKTEFYDEVGYRVSFTAVYIQLYVFLERIAKLDKIVRVSGFTLKPLSAELSESPYIELKGELRLNTYRYKGTRADELGATTPAVAPGAATAGGKT